MTNFVKQSIQEALSITSYHLKELSPLESIVFREKVSLKFADGNDYESLLWEAIAKKGGFSLRDKHAWKWIDEFLQEKEFYLFFEKSDDPTIYVFPEFQSFSKFSEEFPSYIFYLTNENLDYLIYFNDSHYLRCCGTAESWLRKKAIELSKTGWKDMDGKSFE